MYNNVLDLLEGIKNHLSADTALSYIETIEVDKYAPENIPDFNLYGVMIYPTSVSWNAQSLGTESESNRLYITALIRKDGLRSIKFDGVTPPGIIKMITDIRESLKSFFPTENVEIYGDVSAEFTSEFPERGPFYYDGSISFKVQYNPV